MKKNILGIQANFLNPNGITNETSVSLVKDGAPTTCIAEERLSRVKLDGRFPTKAIDQVLENEGISIKDVDTIAVPFLHPAKSNYKYLKSAWKTYFDTGIFLKKQIKDFTWFTLYDSIKKPRTLKHNCLLYTSDAADE